MNSEEGHVQNILNKGHTALWEHDWDGAVQAYNAALQEVPDHPVGLSSLGLALFHQKKFSDSLRIFQQLARQYPEDPMPMERIARIYEREGLLQEAVRSYYQAAEKQLKSRDVDRSLADYRAILRLNPNNQDVRARVAMVFVKLGRKEEAAAEFTDLAAVVQRAGDPNKAQQILEYARQVKPDSIEVSQALTALKNDQPIPLRNLDDKAGGAMRMAQVREIESTHVEATPEASYDPLTEAKLKSLSDLAGALFDEGNDSSRTSSAAYSNLELPNNLPVSDTQPIRQDHKGIQQHISEFIDLHSAEKHDEAAVELEQAIKAGLDLPGADFMLGLFKKDEDSQKAFDHLQKSVRSPDYALASRLLMGEIFCQSGQLKEATACYLQALRLADHETVPSEQVDELDQLYGPILDSQTLITQEKDMRNLCAVISGQLTRPDWRAYLKGARVQLPPQPEGSPPLPLAEMLIDSNSSQMVESLAEVRKLFQQGKYRSAMEESYHALTYAPTYLPLHIQMGDILISQGRISEAIEKFLMVSRLYALRNENSQAIRLLSKVTRLAPVDTTVRKNLIELLRANKRYDEMIEQLMDLANVYYLLADLDEARHYYHTALNLSRQVKTSRDQPVRILHQLADIELQSLNWKEAIKVFEQLRSLQPTDPAPRLALIDLYGRLGINPAALNEMDAYLKLLETENKQEEAENFLDELLIERPEDPEIQKRMTAYYVNLGKYETAIAKLDAQAEKLLVEKNVKASADVVQQIIALNPSNRSDYEKLYVELLKK